MRKKIIILVILVLLLAGGGFYAYQYFTGPEHVVGKALEANNINDVKAYIKENSTDVDKTDQAKRMVKDKAKEKAYKKRQKKLHITYKNVSGKTIKKVEFLFWLYDISGEEWSGGTPISFTDTCKSLKNGETRSAYWDLGAGYDKVLPELFWLIFVDWGLHSVKRRLEKAATLCYSVKMSGIRRETASERTTNDNQMITQILDSFRYHHREVSHEDRHYRGW